MIDVDDIPDLIGYTDNHYAVEAPYRGKKDGTAVNGIKIEQGEGDFEICFDPRVVGGLQSYSELGLVDSNGNGDACTVYDLFPDFCGGTPPPKTPSPVTPAPITPAPITPSPITPQPTTPSPVTAGNQFIIYRIMCRYIMLLMSI